MPVTIVEAVQCAACDRLISKKGKYINIISVDVVEHQEVEPKQYVRHRDSEQVRLNDVVVCDNGCLRNLISLKGCDD